MTSSVSDAEFAMHAYAARCRTITVFSLEIIIITCITLHRHSNRNRPAEHCRAEQVAMGDDIMTCAARAVCDVWKVLDDGYADGPYIVDERD